MKVCDSPRNVGWNVLFYAVCSLASLSVFGHGTWRKWSLSVAVIVLASVVAAIVERRECVRRQERG